MERRTKYFDILCAGELLIDMMSVDFAENFSMVDQFKRVQGGSPANVAMNMARLGNKVNLVAGIGADDMGNFLMDSVAAAGVYTDYIYRSEAPTTLILVTRSKEVSNFEAYRGADCQLVEAQFPEELLRQSTIFHTTCFGMSLPPAQNNILKAAQKAHTFGAQLSIDLNYASKIWSNQAAAQKVVADYCSRAAIVKVSEVDWERLYGEPLVNAEKVGAHFMNLGATTVCVTLGSKGIWAISKNETHFLPARSVEVKDSTGAGDAFWSGFLTAWLDGKSLLECAQSGRNLAEYKIQRFGTLPNELERSVLYE